MAYEISKLERIVSLGSATPVVLAATSKPVIPARLNYQLADSTRIDGQRFEDIGLQPESVLEWPLSEIRRDDPQFGGSSDAAARDNLTPDLGASSPPRRSAGNRTRAPKWV